MYSNMKRAIAVLRWLTEHAARELAKLEHRGNSVTCDFCLRSIPWAESSLVKNRIGPTLCADVDVCSAAFRQGGFVGTRAPGYEGSD